MGNKNNKLSALIVVIIIITISTIIVIINDIDRNIDINSNKYNNLNQYEIENENYNIDNSKNDSENKGPPNRLIVLMDNDFFTKEILKDAFKNCENLNCQIDNNKSNKTKAKTVVYSTPRLLKPNHFGRYNTKRDNPEQLLMTWSMESGSLYTKQEDDSYMSGFNITGGYAPARDDNMETHIYLPYGPVPFSLSHHYSRIGKFEIRKETAPIPQLRNNSIMWVAGNCENEKIGRTELVKQIMDLTQVDSYGKCLHNKELDHDPGYNVDDRSTQKIKLLNKYNFVLAIENSICDDYVTEKLWEPLSAGTIPVYLGAPNINEWLPHPDAIINISHFKSVSSLVDYLKRVESEPALRLKHLQWINQPLPDYFLSKLSLSLKSLDFFCSLCEKTVASETKKLITHSSPFKKCLTSKFTLPLYD